MAAYEEKKRKRSLPGTASTTRQLPDLILLSPTSTTRVRQEPSSRLVVRSINIHTITRRSVDNVARGSDGPFLGGFSGIAGIQNNVEVFGIGRDDLGVDAVLVVVVVGVKGQLDGVVLELPHLVRVGGAVPENDGVVLFFIRERE